MNLIQNFSIIITLFIAFIFILFISESYENINERYADTTYMNTVYINYLISIIFILCIFNLSNISSNYTAPSIKNIVFLFLAIDTVYYFSHYLTHSIVSLKQYIHTTHHNYSKVLPLDNFYLDHYDYIIYSIIILIIPLFITDNSFEYLTYLVISGIHSIYVHSSVKYEFMLPLFIDSDYHSLHHQYGKGNYAFFFPFWDDYMKTRVTELPLKKAESLNEMTIEQFNNQCKTGKKYTIIRKNIIDCELWIAKHPGGAIFIERLIGKDSTEDYEKMHKNSSSANDMLEKLKIARLSTTR